jgi:transposase InsO family protein
VARKYDSTGKRGPKPRKANEVRDLVLRMKEQNRDWGYGHIHGKLMKLGFKVSWQTVRRIMIEHGLIDDPKHTKRMPSSTFINSHFQSLATCDFFTVEAWTPKGLTRFLVFFVIDLSSRRVQIAGIDEAPDGQWMLQQARNLTDPEHGFLKGKRFLIHDRDPLYTTEFRKTRKAGGIRSLKMPKWSPNLNAHCERFVQSIKVECLDKMILFGERHVRYAVEQYAGQYYHEEVRTRDWATARSSSPPEARPTAGRILCRERLGGLLKSYYRKAT